MVSTYQQYLYPDFLNSTSVDSNKSPLALLAQTCNSIGTTDTPSQAQGQKRKHSFDGNTSISGAASSALKSSEKFGAVDSKTLNDTGGHKNKVLKSSPHQADSTTSGDETSSGGASTSNVVGHKETKNDRNVENSNNSTNSNQNHESAINDGKNSSSSSSGQKMMPQMPPHSSMFLPNQTFNSLLNSTHPALGVGSLNPLLSSMSASAFFYPPTAIGHAGLNCLPGFPSTAALAATNPYYSSSAAAAAAAAALSSAFYPKCTDPFCKTCPMSTAGATSLYHHNPSRPCPAGCLQCASAAAAATHPFSTTGGDLTSWYQAYCSLLQQPQGAPPQPILPPPAFTYAPPPSATATTPTCFWDTGDGRYCMKRFTNADEFSQHIKMHTEQQQQKASTPQTSPLQKPPSASPKSVAAATMSLPAPPPVGFPSAYFNPLMHQYRYHPYGKFASANDILMPPPPTSLYNAAALMQQQQSTAQQQRLPGSLPFP